MDVPNVLYNQKLVFPHPQFLVEIGGFQWIFSDKTPQIGRFSTVKKPPWSVFTQGTVDVP